MSLEQPIRKETRTATPEEERIASLQLTLNELNIIYGSIRMERKGTENATANQHRLADEESDVRVARSLGEPSENLETVARDRQAADELVDIYKNAPMVNRETIPIRGEVSEELKEKLRTLGVDVESTDRFLSGTGGAIETAILERTMAVEKELREAKLQVPGGKEEMVAEAILADRLLDDFRLQPITDTLVGLTKVPDLQPSAGKVSTAVVSKMNYAKFYPAPVRQAVVWQVLMRAVQHVPEKRLAETMKKLEELRPEIEKYSA